MPLSVVKTISAYYWSLLPSSFPIILTKHFYPWPPHTRIHHPHPHFFLFSPFPISPFFPLPPFFLNFIFYILHFIFFPLHHTKPSCISFKTTRLLSFSFTATLFFFKTMLLHSSLLMPPSFTTEPSLIFSRRRSSFFLQLFFFSLSCYPLQQVRSPPPHV